MMFDDHRLKKPLAVLLMMLSISVGVLVYGLNGLDQLAQHRDQARDRVRQQLDTYAAKQTWQSVSSADYALVLAKMRDGALGEQSRLVWIDQLVAHSRQVAIRDFQLHLSDRQPLTSTRVSGVTSLMAGAQYETVDVEGYFVHEWEALFWARAVSQQTHLMTLMQRCQLQLISRHFTEEAIDYPVHLSCRWLFLVLPSS